MRITLINAQICEANNLVPPLGILAVGSFLEKHGFSVQLIDEDIFYTDISKVVLEFKPDIIGISFLTPAYTRAKKIISTLKPLLPSALFCAGGFHVSIAPEKSLKDLSLAFCIIGEGEISMLEVCNSIADGKGLEEVDGVCFVGPDDKIYINPPRPLIENLDDLPLPATHLLNYQRYLRPPGLFRGMAMDRIVTLSSSRGCPFFCSYCGGRKLFNGRVRFRSVQSIREELEFLVATHKIRGVWIIDECFTLNRQRSIEISNLLESFGLVWGMQTRVDLLDEQLIRKFKESGCIEINFGVESGVNRILEMLGKETTRETAETVFSWCRAVGMRTTANFMIGSPTETEEEIFETFNFAKQLAASYTVFHITTPLPGTALYEEAIASGRMQEPREFDDSWVHRASKGPLMAIEIPAERVMRLRAQFQNYFFFRNNITIQNLRYGFSLISLLLRYPQILIHSFSAYRKFGRLDSFAETMIALTNKAGK